MKNAERLINEINKKKDSWNERSQFKIGKVGNLSISDLDSIELYANQFMRSGSLNGLMTPRGSVGEVLVAYGIAIKDKGFAW